MFGTKDIQKQIINDILSQYTWGERERERGREGGREGKREREGGGEGKREREKKRCKYIDKLLNLYL